MELETTLTLIGSVMGLAGFWFGIYQYAKAERWKKAEFAAKELEKLSNDSILSLACTMLDWDDRTIYLPEVFKERSKTGSFVHSWDKMRRAMTPALMPDEGSKGFDWKEVLYRDVFDYFFTYLNMMNHYIEIDLIDQKDVSTLGYWLNQIIKSPHAEDTSIFIPYIEQFNYNGVLRLLEKFSVDYK